MDNMETIWHIREFASNSDGVQVLRRADDGISTFKQLEYLMLRDLSGLVCFSYTSCPFLFSSLKEVKIVGCPLMKFFANGILSAPAKFKCTIQLKQADMNKDGDKDSDGDENDDDANDSDNEEQDGNADEEQFSYLNATIKEKLTQIAMVSW